MEDFGYRMSTQTARCIYCVSICSSRLLSWYKLTLATDGGPEVVSLDPWEDWDNVYCGWASEPQWADPPNSAYWISWKLNGHELLFNTYPNSGVYPSIGMIRCCVGPCVCNSPGDWCWGGVSRVLLQEKRQHFFKDMKYSFKGRIHSRLSLKYTIILEAPTFIALYLTCGIIRKVCKFDCRIPAQFTPFLCSKIALQTTTEAKGASFLR
jgi:hypothetical protein